MVRTKIASLKLYINIFSTQGSDDSCIPQPTNTDLRVVSNVSSSDTLGPCQQLGLRVYGGTAPYNISIATVDSPVVTNFTIDVGNDVATWINRADPSHQLIGPLFFLHVHSQNTYSHPYHSICL